MCKIYFNNGLYCAGMKNQISISKIKGKICIKKNLLLYFLKVRINKRFLIKNIKMPDNDIYILNTKTHEITFPKFLLG